MDVTRLAHHAEVIATNGTPTVSSRSNSSQQRSNSPPKASAIRSSPTSPFATTRAQTASHGCRLTRGIRSVSRSSPGPAGNGELVRREEIVDLLSGVRGSLERTRLTRRAPVNSGCEALTHGE